MQDFKKLEIWKLSMEIAAPAYVTTKLFLKEELYGITIQMRRSATSIASNIAEGAGGDYKKEFNQFINIAVKNA